MVADMKITPQTVLLQTTIKLREAIMQGHFVPGERLVELALCARLGVSRTTLREALRKLESERLVTNVPNRGPSVAIISPAEAEQIYHVRKLVEGEAAALFAELADVSQIDALEHALRRFQDAVNNESAVARVTSTSEFYDIILCGCGNQIIREISESLAARVNVLRAKSMANPGRGKVSVTEMRKIFNAIRKHDAIAARAAAETHVVAAHDALFTPAGHFKKAATLRAPTAERVDAGRKNSSIETAAPLIDDDLWALLEPQLPPAKPRRFLHPGRKPVADREALNGILFVLKNGIRWNELPADMGFGSGISCWRRLRDWQQAGIWDRLQAILLAKLRAADPIDFSRAAIEASSIPAVTATGKPNRVQSIARDPAVRASPPPTRPVPRRVRSS